MGEIEELKAKLEEAEQRAARAEALLAETGKAQEDGRDEVSGGSGTTAGSESGGRSESSESSESGANSVTTTTVTNPANSDVGQRSRLAASAAAAARGDRRALLEWATLREEMNIARRNE